MVSYSGRKSIKLNAAQPWSVHIQHQCESNFQELNCRVKVSRLFIALQSWNEEPGWWCNGQQLTAWQGYKSENCFVRSSRQGKRHNITLCVVYTSKKGSRVLFHPWGLRASLHKRRQFTSRIGIGNHLFRSYKLNSEYFWLGKWLKMFRAF